MYNIVVFAAQLVGIVGGAMLCICIIQKLMD